MFTNFCENYKKPIFSPGMQCMSDSSKIVMGHMVCICVYPFKMFCIIVMCQFEADKLN